MLKLENTLAQAACYGPSNLLSIFAAPQAHLGPLKPPPLRHAIAPQRIVLALPQQCARPVHRSRSGESVRNISVRQLETRMYQTVSVQLGWMSAVVL